MKHTLTRDEVAELLDISRGHLDNKYEELLRNNFPTKLPGLNKWSHRAVLDWIECNGQTVPDRDINADITAERAALEQSYGVGA